MLQIASSVLRQIADDAARSPAVEVCGLLFGSDCLIDRAQACRNFAENPADSFEIDPAALFAAYRSARTGGPRVAGWYHSHPSGAAWPSARDAEAAEEDGKLWLIVAGDRVAAFQTVAKGSIHGRFEPVRYDVATSA